MRSLINNTGFAPVDGYLVVEAFMRPKIGRIITLDKPNAEVPQDMQVFVLEHNASAKWLDDCGSELKPGFEIIARPGGQLEFLLPRYVYVIPETNVAAVENITLDRN
jgi:hypothetical protein